MVFGFKKKTTAQLEIEVLNLKRKRAEERRRKNLIKAKFKLSATGRAFESGRKIAKGFQKFSSVKGIKTGRKKDVTAPLRGKRLTDGELFPEPKKQKQGELLKFNF